MRRILSIAFLALLSALPLRAQVDFDHPDFLSFESDKRSSDEHAKFGLRSLKWTWRLPNASLKLKHPVAYQKENPNPEETSVSTFVFWVYSPEALPGSMRVSFLKKGKVCCHFSYRLGFKGWRGAWVAFDRDMEGVPEVGMDEISFKVEGARRGTLYFDGIIPSAFEDVRYHTADFQAPFINAGTDVHWLRLLEHWQKKLDIPLPSALADRDLQWMETIRERFVELTVSDKRGCSLAKARKIAGAASKPVFFTRYAETFLNLGIKDASLRWKSEGQLLRQYNDGMFSIALAWLNCSDLSEKGELERLYLDMARHILDEGFAAGSAQGTLHHLGYSMRNFYTAPVIMKDVLRRAGLLEQMQQAMEWFSGAGEVKLEPEVPGMDIDAFNTYLLSRVAALLLLEDGPYKYAYLKGLSRWIDNGFRYTGGTKACFKTDGTVFHHRRAYPAYAVGGFDGAVKAVWLLHGTPFAVSAGSHSILKKALLEMRFYCNQQSFPLAMSGRHPDGKGALIPYQYALLADAGSPDGKESIDRELAEAYLRLGGEKGRLGRKFIADGFSAESSPTGVRSYSYNCSLSARQKNWLVTIAGHSRYLWSSEIYQGANHYGRYLTHGSMEILSGGNPVSSHGSGFQVDGYDWCHIPGTTAAPLPMNKMKAHVINPDKYSGYEEMLLSDEWFAGGVADGDCGVFAMKLHENDKYNGSLRARKSWFVFGNRIVCLGSDIESDIPVHTTLFQNSLPAPVEADSLSRQSELRDRFGNVWFLSGCTAVCTRTLQHSLHEESDAPTSGWFEKAYILQDKASYEYLTLVQASEDEIRSVKECLPYEVLSRSRSLHCVRSLRDGSVGAAVFEEGRVDELIREATPCLLLYHSDEDGLHLSLCNPDLALYSGEADEILDESGKRRERSVYSRNWIDNDCAPVKVSLTLDGHWTIAEAPEGTVCESDGRKTYLQVTTSEGRSEKLLLI